MDKLVIKNNLDVSGNVNIGGTMKFNIMLRIEDIEGRSITTSEQNNDVNKFAISMIMMLCYLTQDHNYAYLMLPMVNRQHKK